MCSFTFGDRRPQQTLYMGCSSNPHMVSLSPPVENDRQVTNLPMSSSISPYPSPYVPTNQYQPTPRVVYPSSNYLHGNPGFYYDLMQNSTHTGSQTTLHNPPTDHLHNPTYMHTNHSTTSVNTPTHTYPYTPYIPSNPTVHFDHLSSSVPSQDHQATSSSIGGGTSSTVPQYFSYDDPESQSIGIPSDSASVGIQHFFHDNTTVPCMNTLHPNLHVGCPTDIFTKEFKSDCTFRSLRNLLLYPSSSFPCSSLAWGVLGHLEI
jgi:hypothetical protein